MNARNERAAHSALLSSAEWQRMRAGFAIQGPYQRRQRVRVMRWLLAFAAVAALIAWSV